MCAQPSPKGKVDHRAKASQVTKDFLDHLENQFRTEQLEKVYELHGKIADTVRPYRLETVLAALRIVEHQVIQAELDKQEQQERERFLPKLPPEKEEPEKDSQAAIS